MAAVTSGRAVDHVSEERLVDTARELEKRRGWGLATQLYSVRSKRSWGIGDFADLADLAALSGARRAGFILVNPLHAAAPAAPMEPSPYLPTSRRFVNPLYLRPESIPEYAELRHRGSHVSHTIVQLPGLNTTQFGWVRAGTSQAKNRNATTSEQPRVTPMACRMRRTSPPRSAAATSATWRSRAGPSCSW